MSELENYKKLLREFIFGLPTDWTPGKYIHIIDTENNQKYFPAICWGIKNGIFNDYIEPFNCGNCRFQITGDPVTLNGYQFLKTEGDRHMEIIDNKKYKSVLKKLKSEIISDDGFIVDCYENNNHNEYIDAINWAISEKLLNEDNMVIWGTRDRYCIYNNSFTPAYYEYIKSDLKKQFSMIKNEILKQIGKKVGDLAWAGILIIISIIISIIVFIFNISWKNFNLLQ